MRSRPLSPALAPKSPTHAHVCTHARRDLAHTLGAKVAPFVCQPFVSELLQESLTMESTQETAQWATQIIQGLPKQIA